MLEAKLLREYGYTQSKKDVSKWNEFVNEFENADTVSYPLEPTKLINVTNKTIVSTFQPTNDFEKSIENILVESKLDKKTFKQYDQLPVLELNEEKLKLQQDEMMKMKNILFYAQQKAARQKKIKSKTFRKIARKKREKLQSKLLDGLPNEILDMEEEKKSELLRIEERMRQRHSKKKSKFVKNASKHESYAKQALHQEVQIKRDLLAKMTSKFDDDDENDEEQQQQEDELLLENLPQTGILAMKFMKNKLQAQNEDLKEEKGKLNVSHVDAIMSGDNQKGNSLLTKSAVQKLKTSDPLIVDLNKKSDNDTINFEVEPLPKENDIKALNEKIETNNQKNKKKKNLKKKNEFLVPTENKTSMIKLDKQHQNETAQVISSEKSK